MEWQREKGASKNMDAVRFGRWLGERRHACGWHSQRAFAEAASQDARVLATDITENFVARLLALAPLLCDTPAALRAYLRAAERGRLRGDERAQVDEWARLLARGPSSPAVSLPPRPGRLFGQETALRAVLSALRQTGLCVITGMPGIGKTAL